MFNIKLKKSGFKLKTVETVVGVICKKKGRKDPLRNYTSEVANVILVELGFPNAYKGIYPRMVKNVGSTLSKLSAKEVSEVRKYAEEVVRYRVSKRKFNYESLREARGKFGNEEFNKLGECILFGTCPKYEGPYDTVEMNYKTVIAEPKVLDFKVEQPSIEFTTNPFTSEGYVKKDVYKGVL